MYKRKFQVALILDQKIEEGGGYQQSINSALSASKLRDELYTIKIFTIFKKDIKKLKKFNIDSEYLNYSLFLKLITHLKTNPKLSFIYKIIVLFINCNPLEKILIKKRVDLVYFLSPSKYSICLGNLNFIYSIWDICHRDNPEFPEVKTDYEFEKREFLYSNVLPKAIGIIVDSFITKEKLCRIYNLEKEKVIVIPFEPAPLIKESDKKLIKKSYPKINNDLNSPYIFYPAQFWPHKNHIYILESISILKKVFKIKMNVVFTGSNKGNLNYIVKSANQLQIKDQVSFLGFVSNVHLLDIYIKSFALVMPTYFGPTNLPPLEAFKLGVPVFYPDFKEMKEQVGDAAIFIDIYNPNSLAEQINNLYYDNKLRRKIIRLGKKRYQEIKQTNRSKDLSDLIRKFCTKRKCWE